MNAKVAVVSMYYYVVVPRKFNKTRLHLSVTDVWLVFNVKQAVNRKVRKQLYFIAR